MAALDILVNDAAYNKWIPFNDLEALTYEEWQKILDVNLTGPMLCIKAVAPIMQRQGAGRIVNIALDRWPQPLGGRPSPMPCQSRAHSISTRCMAVGLAPDIPGQLRRSRLPGRYPCHSQPSILPTSGESRMGALLKRAADERDDIADQVCWLSAVRTASRGQTLSDRCWTLFTNTSLLNPMNKPPA